MIENIVVNRKEWIFYIPIVTLFVILTSIFGNLFIKALMMITPLIIVVVLHYIKRPADYLIVYFFLSPLAHPIFLNFLSLTTIEILTIPTILLGVLSISLSWDNDTEDIFLENKHIFLAFFLLAFFGLISTLANIGRMRHLVGIQSFILENTATLIGRPIFYAIIFLMGVSKFKKDRVISLLLFAIFIGAFLVGVFEIFVLLTLKPDWAFDFLTLRVRATFLDYNELGAYSALMIFFIIGFFSIAKNNMVKILCILTVIVAIISLLTSRTIGSILGVFGGMFVYNFSKKHAVRNILIFVVITLFVFLMSNFLYPQILSKLFAINERLMDRVIVNYTGLKVIRHNFWFGVGSAIVVYMQGHPHIISSPWGVGSCVPHHFILTNFAQGGIFYCVSLIYLVVAIFEKLKVIYPKIKKSKNSSFYYALLGGITAFFIQANTNQLFFNIRVGTFVIFFLALFIKFEREGDFNFCF